MKFPDKQYPHSELTSQIIAASHAVHGEHGPGLDEKIYENSLCIEFAEQRIFFEQQKNFSVHYKGRFVGKLIPDLIVGQKVVVDAKMVENFTDTHFAQISSYLKITGLEVGLLIKFKHASVVAKRVANLNKNQFNQ